MTANEKLRETEKTVEEMFLDPENLENYDPSEVISIFESI